jgi:hypothetical protein
MRVSIVSMVASGWMRSTPASGWRQPVDLIDQACLDQSIDQCNRAQAGPVDEPAVGRRRDRAVHLVHQSLVERMRPAPL